MRSWPSGVPSRATAPTKTLKAEVTPQRLLGWRTSLPAESEGTPLSNPDVDKTTSESFIVMKIRGGSDSIKLQQQSVQAKTTGAFKT